MAAKSAGSRLAPPTSAPSTSGPRERLGQVVRLDRAAVEDAHLLGGVRVEVADQRADEGRARPAPARASRPCRCRSPTPARRRSPRPPSRSAGTSARSSVSWRRSTASVSPRSCSVARLAHAEERDEARPPAPRAPSCAAPASVSPKSSRRSEWPSSTPSTSTSDSMGAETSPVRAPLSSSCMVWAYTASCEPRAESTTAWRARKDGHTPKSTPSTDDTRGSSACT